MKHDKLYNIIFPIWILLFFPPLIFITLIGNFIIDSLVMLACFFIYKLSDTHNDLKIFYKNNILKVWMYGFLADIMGTVILFAIGTLGDFLGLPYELISAIYFDPFSHLGGVIIIIFAMLVASYFIYLFNYRIVFQKQILDEQLRFKVSLTIAIVTIPWTFLLPSKWFY
ncbi:hypothetical protein Dtox_1930 [Desulfofarcimen acetoxidans DSM 771]|jgi:hypothetical protein|uniref:Uncharacterized protein n=1 Tax=Desulfofarcimen acetoxidans (strain ATCC 49208 / DSM 771 / KCTC 5769 / VKM B-1644 / 5575) TaxID=485916 RepID=C8VY88_DESAS|nr:hypothetical protein [Desulfofarcimen acetoxidans]ACV62769.1 hypothetical protein Dtox_1930 [Desulfofarcimen acetoxidans DSM 771]